MWLPMAHKADREAHDLVNRYHHCSGIYCLGCGPRMAHKVNLHPDRRYDQRWMVLNPPDLPSWLCANQFTAALERRGPSRKINVITRRWIIRESRIQYLSDPRRHVRTVLILSAESRTLAFEKNSKSSSFGSLREEEKRTQSILR